LSSSVLFDKVNTRNPINRRISIIVMTREAEESALKTDTATEIPADVAAKVLGHEERTRGQSRSSAATLCPPVPAATGAAPVIQVPDSPPSPAH
jgi:chemotaxis protein MotB